MTLYLCLGWNPGTTSISEMSPVQLFCSGKSTHTSVPFLLIERTTPTLWWVTDPHLYLGGGEGERGEAMHTTQQITGTHFGMLTALLTLTLSPGLKARTPAASMSPSSSQCPNLTQYVPPFCCQLACTFRS